MQTTEVVSQQPRIAHLPAAQAEIEELRSPAGSPPGKGSRRKRSRKWLAGIGAIVVLGAAAVAYYYYFGGAQHPVYLTAPVDRGDIDATISATGNCNAVVTVQVGSQVSGNISALYADFNTKVKQNQLVARIDPAMFQARVDQAKANLDGAKQAVITARATLTKSESDIANAEANVASQKANVVRAQSAVTLAKVENDRRVVMLQEKIISQEDADTAKAAYDQAVANLDAANAALTASESAVESAKAQRDVAQAQLDGAAETVKQDQAALDQAALDLEHTQIRAPVDGVVVSRNMDVGQTVAASFQAPTIFLIAQDLTKMQVDTNVDESDVGPVRVGQHANFTVDAYPGAIFRGAVTQIRQAPINVQNVITYDIVVGVSNQDLKLFPGMTANVKILTGRAENALRIPVAALRFRPASASAGARPKSPAGTTKATQGLQTVYLLDEHGNPKAAQVKLGLSDGNFLEVLSGLTEGQRVVTGTASKAASSSAAPSAPGGTRRIGF
jgi:HlyD family secretion protein